MTSWFRLALAMSVLVILTADTTASAQSAAAPADLVGQFRDEPEFFRQLEIARRIASSGDRNALRRLEPWLTHEDRHARGNAALVFARLGDRRGLDVLRDMLSDRSDRPLGQGIGAISANVENPGWWMGYQLRADRYYAVHLIGELRDAQAVAILLDLLGDPELAYKAVWALGEIGAPAVINPLIAALGNPDALVRVSAIQALEKMQATQAVPHLQALLSDDALPNAGPQISVGETARAALEKLR